MGTLRFKSRKEMLKIAPCAGGRYKKPISADDELLAASAISCSLERTEDEATVPRAPTAACASKATVTATMRASYTLIRSPFSEKRSACVMGSVPMFHRKTKISIWASPDATDRSMRLRKPGNHVSDLEPPEAMAKLYARRFPDFLLTRPSAKNFHMVMKGMR